MELYCGETFFFKISSSTHLLVASTLAHLFTKPSTSSLKTIKMLIPQLYSVNMIQGDHASSKTSNLLRFKMSS